MTKRFFWLRYLWHRIRGERLDHPNPAVKPLVDLDLVAHGLGAERGGPVGGAGAGPAAARKRLLDLARRTYGGKP